LSRAAPFRSAPCGFVTQPWLRLWCCSALPCASPLRGSRDESLPAIRCSALPCASPLRGSRDESLPAIRCSALPYASPLRILIRQLLIKDVSYVVRGPAVQDVDGTLPSISMTDVGGTNGGTPGEIGKVIFGDLSEREIKQAAKEGIQSAVEDKIKTDIGGGLGDALKKLGN
jgi:hypothetical protein